VIRRARPTFMERSTSMSTSSSVPTSASALRPCMTPTSSSTTSLVPGRAGKFKPGVGLERLQGDDDTTFVERGLPSQLGPQRDIGFQVGANLFRNRVAYQLGVFDGVPDSSIGTDTAVSDHRDYAARLFLTPFAPNENVLKGLGLGVAVEGGSTDGEALPSYKTFGQESFFTFASGVTAAGHRTVSIRKPTTMWDPSACWRNTLSTKRAFRKRGPQGHRISRLSDGGQLHPHRREENLRQSHAETEFRCAPPRRLGRR